MARNAFAISKRWKQKGVRYTPDVDEFDEDGALLYNHQAIFREWHQLHEAVATGQLVSAEIKKAKHRIDTIEPLFRGRLMVQLIPMSGKDMADESAEQRLTVVTGMIDEDTGRPTFSADPMQLGELFVSHIVGKCVTGVWNYRARGEIEIPGEFDEEGEPKTELVLVEPKIGPELVAFIRDHCWDEERHLVADIFKAIKKRSHLLRGIKKASSSSPDSELRIIRRFPGDVATAPERTTSTIQTDPPKQNLEAPAIATALGQEKDSISPRD